MQLARSCPLPMNSHAMPVGPDSSPHYYTGAPNTAFALNSLAASDSPRHMPPPVPPARRKQSLPSERAGHPVHCLEARPPSDNRAHETPDRIDSHESLFAFPPNGITTREPVSPLKPHSRAHDATASVLSSQLRPHPHGAVASLSSQSSRLADPVDLALHKNNPPTKSPADEQAPTSAQAPPPDSGTKPFVAHGTPLHHLPSPTVSQCRHFDKAQSPQRAPDETVASSMPNANQDRASPSRNSKTNASPFENKIPSQHVPFSFSHSTTPLSSPSSTGVGFSPASFQTDSFTHQATMPQTDIYAPSHSHRTHHQQAAHPFPNTYSQHHAINRAPSITDRRDVHYSSTLPAHRRTRSTSTQHAKPFAENSFDFSIEATVTLPLQRQQQEASAQHMAPTMGYNRAANGYDNEAPESFHTTREFAHGHRRSSTSTTLNSMASSNTGMSTPKYTNKQSFQQPARQASISSNAAHHRRIGSVSSQMSRNSQVSRASHASRPSSELAQNSMVSGSFYVHELRRRSAATWCDIPATVWGVPIGIADESMLSSSQSGAMNSSGKKMLSLSRSGTTSSSQRRVMDIRHSHLTPRLLASEIDDDGEDSPTSAGNFNSPSADYSESEVSRNSSLSHGSTLALGIPSNPNTISTGAGAADLSLLTERRVPSASPPELSRTPSASSVKSLEETTKHIKLFVANPDL